MRLMHFGGTPGESDRAARLFSSVIGDTQRMLKSAARVAKLLEEQFIRDGWPVGRVYGREIELTERFGVGRAVVREAARILEARGTARMRRGPHGGLVVTAPATAQLFETIGCYCHLSGVTREGLLRTRHSLDRIASKIGRSSPVLALFRECLEHLLDFPEPGPDSPPARPGGVPRRNRAGQIVQLLMRDIGTEEWTQGCLLGSELDLCEQFRADRGVLRQAVRILEAAGTAVAMPGRGHGLVTCAPGPAAASRLMCCYFASRGIRYGETMEMFHQLSLEAVSLAAERARPEDEAELFETLEALERREGPLTLSDLMEAEERQFAVAREGLLELLVRSVKAYPSWGMASNVEVPDTTRRIFIEASREVASAIAAGNGHGAAQAQERKFHRLLGNIRHVYGEIEELSASASAQSSLARVKSQG
jgi:DNA-binding FadR family transcriptional regulator